MATPPTANSPPRSGFSLIELLVVVAIIGVLASLLLGAIGVVKDMAKRATCSGHLRQIGLAIHVYTEENEGLLPFTHLTYWNGGSVVQGYTWCNVVAKIYELPVPAVGRPPKFLSCPASRLIINKPSSAISDFAKNEHIAKGHDVDLPAGPRPVVPVPVVPLSRVTKTGSTYLVMDGRSKYDNNLINRGVSFDDAILPDTATHPDQSTGAAHFRHRGMVNVLFFDFHVEPVSFTAMPTKARDAQADKKKPWSQR